MTSIKNYVLAFITLLIGLAAGYFYGRPSGAAPPEAVVENISPKAAQVPKDTLSIDSARIYVANYAPRAGVVFSYGPNPIMQPDTRAVWFPAWRLKELINQLESEGGNGIRFYFATYNRDYAGSRKSGPIPDADYWGHNTLIMVPTRKFLNKRDKYINQDYFAGQASKIKGFLVTPSPENNGELCPPPSPCKEAGALLIEPVPNPRQ